MKHALALLILSATVALGQPTLANSDDITAAKARANHTGTQPLSTLSQSGATTGQAAVWNGAEWAAATVSGGGDLTAGPVRSTGGTSSIADGAIGIAKITGLGTAATTNTTAYAPARRLLTASATAAVGDRISLYPAGGGLVSVTDPTGTTQGQSYTVIVQNGTMQFNGTGTTYAASRFELVRSYNGSAWTTLTPVVSDALTLASPLGISSGGTGATNSTAARDNLGTSGINAGAQRGLRNRLASTAGANGDVVAYVLGDSFALSAYGGLEKNCAILGSTSCGTISTSSATLMSDYTKSPDGRYYQITTGGNITIGHLQFGVDAPVDKIYYTLFNGTGTAIIEFSTNGGSSWTTATGGTIDTTAIAVGGVSVGIATPTVYNPSVRSRLRASGGTVNGYLGQGKSGAGVTITSFATSGQDIGQSASVSETVWKAMIAGHGVSLIMTQFADERYTSVTGAAWAKGTNSWAASGPIDTLRTWSKVSAPLCDWMVVGAHRVDPALTDATDATLDPLYTALGIGSSTDERLKDGAKAAREWAELRGEGFVDMYNLWPSFSQAFADGMYLDESLDIHASAKGKDSKIAALFSQSNIGSLFGDDISRSMVRLGKNYLLGGDLRTGTASVLVSGSASYFQPTAITAGALRAAVKSGTTSDESAASGGVQVSATSASVMRLGNYNSGFVEVSISGSGGILYPVTVASSSLGTASKPFEGLYLDKTVTAPGTTAPQPINKYSGRINFAAGDSSKLVTNSKVTANSIIVAIPATNDTTMKSVGVVATTGSFTLYANAAATAETAVNFIITN